jgi:hypothetical protein
MLDNHLYNLAAQLVEDHRSLWRMRDQYANDAGECSKCREIWEKMAKSRAQELAAMTELLREHL